MSETLAGELVDCVEGYSSYVQQLAWILWSSVEKVASDADLLLAMDPLMDSCQPTYIVQIEALTAKQMALLRAVAEGVEEGRTYDTTYSRQISLGHLKQRHAFERSALES